MRNFSFLVMFLMAFSMFSQKQQSKEYRDSVRQSKILKAKQAIVKDGDLLALQFSSRYKDYQATVGILYRLIARYPKTPVWRDSLCITYFKMGAYSQCILVAKDVLGGNVNNEKVAVITASSYKNLNLTKDALIMFENLDKRYKNLYYKYEVAQLQLELKRYGEFKQTLDSIYAVPKTKIKNLSLNITSEAGVQHVPFSAAVHNLNGVFEKEQGNKAQAKKSFKMALKDFPEFKLAKSNLESL